MFNLAPNVQLFLASASPRRTELLATLGINFTVRATNISEPSPSASENAKDYALRLATLKGHAALGGIEAKNSLVLAADTTVSLDGEILGKPENPDDALRMLRKLAGRAHEVITAVFFCMRDGNFEKGLASSTKVWFHDWPESALAAYAHCSEPLDKAGAYAIQGKGAFLVDRIEGSWTNVVGLPLAEVAEFLLRHGFICKKAANHF